MPAVIAMTVALVLGAVGIVIGLVVTRTSESDGPSPTISYPGATGEPTGQTDSSTVWTTPTTTSISQNPEQDLRTYVNKDRSWVTDNLDRWVPQISSKRPGVFDEGVEWDNAKTLQEHLKLRAQYDAKLLWSGDWSTFSADDFWVTVAGVSYATADGALAWCRSANRDSWHCFAKLISTTHSVEGSTAYN